MASPSAYKRLMLKIASVLPEKFRAVFLHPAGMACSIKFFLRKRLRLNLSKNKDLGMQEIWI